MIVRVLRWMAVFVCALVLVGGAEARQKEVTLLLVPLGDEELVRVGQDIEARFPTLLLRYESGPAGIKLHGWAKTEWVNIKLADYALGNFFKNGPKTAILIGREAMPIPSLLVPPEAWCDNVAAISTTDTRPVLHLLGQYFDFSHSDWKWFSARYNQPFDAINPDGLNVKWYHRRGSEHLKAGAGSVAANDMQYWTVIRRIADVVEPVAAEAVTSEKAEKEAGAASEDGDEPIVIEPIEEEIPADEAASDAETMMPEVDPFETDVAPAAEVLTAPNVDETETPETMEPETVELESQTPEMEQAEEPKDEEE
jgi:hypothetical protein